MKTGYDFNTGDTVYALIPVQYRNDVLYRDGVETPCITYTGSKWVKGRLDGTLNSTSGFFFVTDKPIDGGLYFLDANTPMKEPATASDMVRKAL